MRNKEFILIPIFIAALGCAPKSKNSPGAPNNASEVAYCSVSAAATNPVILSGTAVYQYYKADQDLGLTTDMGGEPFAKPIRRAEIRVTNAQGTLIHCGETGATGAISLAVEKPATATTYFLEVTSRADNTYMKASILDKVNTKAYYSVKVSFDVSPGANNITLPAIVATATGTLEGGAFHILDRILDVNHFLRNNTTDVKCPGCQGFTVAPKVTVFWKPGFNPASYFGEKSPLSFYDVSASIDSAPALYLLGGAGDDVDFVDTDHFDESVIIHEYGHFLENTFWRSDSPGGYHNGNMIIDPRLAFSEGFANFLPSAVLSRATYIDTIGSPNGSPDVGVFLNLEEETGIHSRDRIITKTALGEGIYREVSVSRAFYDYIDPYSAADKTYDINGVQDQVNETAEFSFAYLWQALTNASFGLNAPDQRFISMGQFNKSLYSSLEASSFSDINAEKAKLDTARIGEFQTRDTSAYAAKVVKSDSSCGRIMTPVGTRTSSGGDDHDYFLSSDFFRIDHTGGVMDLQLSYTGTGDLDLYVFKEVHAVTEPNDLVALSEAANATAGNTESISVNLPAGIYMIFINVDTSVSFSSSLTYSLTSGGKFLCPSL